MQSINTNIDTIRTTIKEACIDAKREAECVTLLAVSKTRSVAEIEQALANDIQHLGENYLQEAVEKITSLAGRGLIWHFIGAIQSNKTRAIATHFDWVHTIDRLKIARRLNQHCLEIDRTLNICIQVNIDDEPQKAGVSPAILPDLVDQVSTLERLHLRGLMAIPQVDTITNLPSKSTSELVQSNAQALLQKQLVQKQKFVALARLFNQQIERNPTLTYWDTLSMGMTGDYVAAIHAGSTIVRIGSAIFGPRTA
ncbi:MAG: YggS family pyridoxal phosphate-dependent enzyme [Pseudomonadales bacterium]|nr:YggS family pyridoxal phosphate-dependent enzyme [Pseudomonadales bacterium]